MSGYIGKGQPVAVEDGSVETDDIVDGAVTAAKLAAGAAVPSQSTHSGKFLTTDGSDASWATVDTNLVGDTSPQLGGDLDLNSNDITGTGNIDVTGNVTAVDSGGSEGVRLTANENGGELQLINNSGTVKVLMDFADWDDDSVGNFRLYHLGSTGDLQFGIPQSSTGYLRMYTNGVERITVNSAGNVGIGVVPDNLNGKLTISAKDADGDNLSLLSSSTSGKATINFGTDASDTEYDGADYPNMGIGVYQDSNNYGIMEFMSHSTSGWKEIMRLVGSDGTTAGGTTDKGVVCSNAGIVFDRGWANYPSITMLRDGVDGDDNSSTYNELRLHGTNSTFDSYPSSSGADFSTDFRIDGATYASSDRRKKDNIHILSSGLAKINALKPSRFNLINSMGGVDSGNLIGFIAQDTIEVIPEAVKYYEDEDTPNENGWANAYSINYTAILATAVKAIQELSSENKSLIARIEELTTRIETLENK